MSQGHHSQRQRAPKAVEDIKHLKTLYDFMVSHQHGQHMAVSC